MSTRSARLGVVASIFTAASALLFACADSGDERPPDRSDSGTTVLPEVDGSAAADGADADVGPVDAGHGVCSAGGFCHTVLPPGQNLRGVWGDGQGIVWAVSLEGTILRWDGSSWNIHHQHQAAAFSVWGSGPTDVWVSTASGVLRGTGASSAALVFAAVNDLPGDVDVPVKSIWGTGPDDIWAVGGDERQAGFSLVTRGRVLHYTGSTADGGAGWSVDAELSASGVSFRTAFGSATSGTWVLGLESEGAYVHARAFRRRNSADVWSSVPLEKPSQNHRLSPTDVVSGNLSSDTSVWVSVPPAPGAGVSGTGALYRGTSADGDTFTWTFTSQSRNDRVIEAFWGTGPDDTWAVGELGLVSHWNGAKWQQAVIRLTGGPVLRHMRAIWGKDSQDFWVVGDEIALRRVPGGKP